MINDHKTSLNTDYLYYSFKIKKVRMLIELEDGVARQKLI